MSHAWLTEWRSAAMTPVAATSSSRMLIGPSSPVLSSAERTASSVASRSALCASGTLSKMASTVRSRTSESSNARPSPPTSSIVSGTALSTAKNAICAASRCPRSSTNSRIARLLTTKVLWIRRRSAAVGRRHRRDPRVRADGWCDDLS